MRTVPLRRSCASAASEALRIGGLDEHHRRQSLSQWQAGRPGLARSACPLATDRSEFVWIGLFEPNEAELRQLQKNYDLHPLAIEELAPRTPAAEVDIYGDQLFVVARPAHLVNGQICYGETSVFVGDTFIISVRHGSERAHPARQQLSRDSLNDQRIDSSLQVQGSHGCVDCAVEGVGISEGLMCQMVRLEIVPDTSMSLSSGAYFGSHSTVSQCLRASMALRVSLLTWIGPLSSTSTTGFIARPG